MILFSCLDRLSDLVGQDKPLRQVQGAIEFAAASAAPPARHLRPAAWVIPISDRAEGNSLVGKVRQRVTYRFGVVLAHGIENDRAGGRTTLEMEALEKAVIGHLLGWQPNEDMEEVLYAGARTVAFQAGLVWRLLEFTTASYVYK
ncbi:hypothetical protein [Telmatospirillum sp. J64-1]|uniref:phage tail terminator protein n=1 Tax=Telmatospirillum sp. J64-1 TaxID=2502183 RepID=UPI00115EF13D|nr:hypothetical protein [Telmatospirillum sp. J64-1]